MIGENTMGELILLCFFVLVYWLIMKDARQEYERQQFFNKINKLKFKSGGFRGKENT
jgi:preprotein translocase subunit YajC